MSRTLVRAGLLAAVVVGIAGEVVAVMAATSSSARLGEVSVGAAVLTYGVAGTLICWFHPGHRIGQLLVALCPTWGLGEALVAVAFRTLSQHPGATWAAAACVAGSGLRALPWLVAVLWLPLRFPDGERLGTRLSRIAEPLSLTVLALSTANGLFSPGVSDTRLPQVRNPIGLPQRWTGVSDALGALTIVLGMATIVMAVGVLVQRFRRTGALGRQQTMLFAASFLPPILALAASFDDRGTPLLFGLVSLPMPVLIAIAVLQRRLYDVPLLMNRSLTYGALWVCIALLYAITVGGVGAFVRQEGAGWLPWFAAGVVAVCFAPLRQALQQAANRLTYGQWAEPSAILARTRDRLVDAGDESLLASLVAELDAGLGLGFVEVTRADGGVLASSGKEPATTDSLPLTTYGAQVGTLRWAARPLRDSDRALLSDLAGQLGAVVHADGLLASVRHAQERLVLAREEERRRLRRDLHDGLGPALAGLALQVDTVRNQTEDPTARTALEDLRSRLGDTVVDVRGLVEGLRPAALDGLGLVASIEQFAQGLTVPTQVDAEPLPALPAAVEVAAYRIVQEALTNAERHARASRLTVQLCAHDETLRLQVSDDGLGVLTPRPDGVGLGSMRERAEEIGGSFAVTATPGQGTVVAAQIPVAGRWR